MMERFMRAFRRSRDRFDILAMSERELADLGVSRIEALALVALPDDVPGRVVAMGHLYGLDEDRLVARRPEWTALLETCNGCCERGACARLMARGDEARAAQAGFCPNAGHFADLAATLH